MLRYLTAGESHGRGLLAILDGLPAGLKIDREFIDAELKARQGGYGRGGRMEIESDRAEIWAGVRDGATIGSPRARNLAARSVLVSPRWQQPVTTVQPAAPRRSIAISSPKPSLTSSPSRRITKRSPPWRGPPIGPDNTSQSVSISGVWTGRNTAPRSDNTPGVCGHEISLSCRPGRSDQRWENTLGWA